MKLFKCQICDQLLYFENSLCMKCGHRLGFLPQAAELKALEPDGELWRPAGANDKRYLFCANAELGVCNWLVPVEGDKTLGETYCLACRHNRTIPDMSDRARLAAWRKLELAKHRLFYSLMRLNLPLANRSDDPDGGLAFDFLADPPDGGSVMTGHDSGLITLALQEGDDGERERRRTAMGEPYRTLLGHFRHEIGHYYWMRLIDDEDRLATCRALFGDERDDYSAALQRYYASGPPESWQERYISAYATSHPWEDFVETWAHYLHIVDTLETAAAFGIKVRPTLDTAGELAAKVDFDPYRAPNIETLIESWLPISFAVNSISRSMGQPEVYPFILSAAVIEKLGFIHNLIHSERRKRKAQAKAAAQAQTARS